MLVLILGSKKYVFTKSKDLECKDCVFYRRKKGCASYCVLEKKGMNESRICSDYGNGHYKWRKV